jgi:hypothetical protein
VTRPRAGGPGVAASRVRGSDRRAEVAGAERAEAALEDIARLVDAAVSSRALVFGSLPPAGRDLDLLLQPADHRTATARLAAAGLDRHGDSWALFADCSAAAVDLVRGDEWALPQAEEEALLAEALPRAEEEALFAEALPLDGPCEAPARPPASRSPRRPRRARELAEIHGWKPCRNIGRRPPGS